MRTYIINFSDSTSEDSTLQRQPKPDPEPCIYIQAGKTIMYNLLTNE